jgi:hypothetical protein
VARLAGGAHSRGDVALGQLGNSTPRGTPGPGHGRARELSVRASSAVRTSRLRAQPRHEPVGAVRSGTEGKRDEDEEGSETYEQAPLVSDCEEGKEMVVSWAAVSARVGPAGGLLGWVDLLGQLGRRFT